jgi:hypothetical protein
VASAVQFLHFSTDASIDGVSLKSVVASQARFVHVDFDRGRICNCTGKWSIVRESIITSLEFGKLTHVSQCEMNVQCYLVPSKAFCHPANVLVRLCFIVTVTGQDSTAHGRIENRHAQQLRSIS